LKINKKKSRIGSSTFLTFVGQEAAVALKIQVLKRRTQIMAMDPTIKQMKVSTKA